MKQVVMAVTLSAWLGTAAIAEEAKVGAPAPAFTLKDERGKEHSLAQYKGKIVVLEWTNPECPFVQRHYEADTMDKTLKASDPKKVVWLAIDSTSHNTPDKSAAWKAEQKITYPILQDPDGKVGKAYGAKTTPHMYVIDEQGVLQYAGAIDDDPRGRDATPVNHVRNALDAVSAGKALKTNSSKPYGCSVKYKNS